jgi:hypothetical protein
MCIDTEGSTTSGVVHEATVSHLKMGFTAGTGPTLQQFLNLNFA